MKIKWLLTGIIVVATMMLTSACTHLPTDVAVSESDSGKQREIVVRGTVTVTLDSNTTTGYSWELTDISDSAVLQKIDSKYEAPNSGLIGAEGKEVWTFKALKDGKATITMSYGQPWAGGQKSARTFTLTVVSKYATK
jgi:inhibitor of cysteine peptidase